VFSQGIRSIDFSPDGQFLAFTTAGLALVVARNPLAPVAPASVRLASGGPPTQAGFPLMITGQAGASYQLDRSEDLKQ